MLRTEQASRAVELALRIASDVGEQHGSPAVRVGINTGAAIERGGDWFGGTVNVAARVAGAAAGGQVLLTESTREAAGRLDSIELLPRGRRTLRNVSEPVLLYEAVAGGATTGEGLPVDPVCRMAVDPIHSVGSLRYRGAVFSFCSFECADSFARDLDRFARGERRRGGC
jgi:YHS domain-containing protein